MKRRVCGRWGRALARIAGIALAAGLMPAGWPTAALAQDDHGFRFVRIRYGDDGGSRGGNRGGFGRRGFGRAPWAHDWDTADLNFHTALERTTRIHVNGEPIVLTLSDPRIFEHPVLYICEPGYWTMSDEEAANLREYLNRGGFVLFDDFRSMREWEWFAQQMRLVLPDTEPTQIPPDHPIWEIYYSIDPVAAPSLVSGYAGLTDADEYHAYFDENGRMIALACYNQDIGDGWEWPEDNINQASTISFQMGINFLIYALTH